MNDKETQMISGIPKGMTLCRSETTMGEKDQKISGVIHASLGKNPLMCRIDATCNSYTMTNHFSSEETLSLLETREQEYALLKEEHERLSRKYRVSKMLLKEFFDIMETTNTTESDKYRQVARLHSKMGSLFVSKREREEDVEENDKKKPKTQ